MGQIIEYIDKFISYISYKYYGIAIGMLTLLINQNPSILNANIWVSIALNFIIIIFCILYSLFLVAFSYDLKLISFSSSINLKSELWNILVCYFTFLIAYANFYLICSITIDDAFNHELNAISSIYFSIVTAATVGYGDFYPTNYVTQILVACEIITTLLYTILVISKITGSGDSRIK